MCTPWPQYHTGHWQLFGPWRNNTARSEMAGSQLVFTQIEPNWPLRYSTMPVPRWRDAGWVTYIAVQYMRVQSREPAIQGSKRFHSIVKTIHLSYLPINYLWFCPSKIWILFIYSMLATLIIFLFHGSKPGVKLFWMEPETNVFRPTSRHLRLQYYSNNFTLFKREI